jgi:hypothetical protein
MFTPANKFYVLSNQEDTTTVFGVCDNSNRLVKFRAPNVEYVNIIVGIVARFMGLGNVRGGKFKEKKLTKELRIELKMMTNRVPEVASSSDSVFDKVFCTMERASTKLIESDLR